MGIRLVVEVLDSYHGSAIKKLWLLAFAEKASDKTRQGWPGREVLAHRADVSQSRASNLATELVRDGVVKRVGGGGRNRGAAMYELLPLDPGDPVDNSSQGAPRTNPDNTPQSSPRPNPERTPQGSESRPQGSESGPQGSAVSPLPAETPYNPQNPHVKQPSSLSHRGENDGERENDSGDDDDLDPDTVLLARAVEGADWADVEWAVTSLQYRKHHGEIRTSVRAYLRACIRNGDARALVDEAAAERRESKADIARHGDPFAAPRTPNTVPGHLVSAAAAGPRTEACRSGSHPRKYDVQCMKWCTCPCHTETRRRAPAATAEPSPHPDDHRTILPDGWGEMPV